MNQIFLFCTVFLVSECATAQYWEPLGRGKGPGTNQINSILNDEAGDRLLIAGDFITMLNDVSGYAIYITK